MTSIKFRPAAPEDASAIRGMLLLLAEDEGLTGRMFASEEDLKRGMFLDRAAEVLLAIDGETAAGFALFYPHFATFSGKTALYMEELFVKREYRRLGIGRELMARLAGIASERGWFRMEWPCMRDNRSAQAFYTALGAKKLTDRDLYRIDPHELI